MALTHDIKVGVRNVCPVCGRLATQCVQDLIEYPSKFCKVGRKYGAIRYGCPEHPVVVRVHKLDGTTVELK